MTATRPFCFVLMPFGRRPIAGGASIDFDAVYEQIIRPAVVEAGLDPIRADEERNGGIIHKPMFERLLLCEYAVADLTSSNANVFYELGVRHAVRPRSTVMLFAQDSGQLPFDVRMLRALPYRLTPAGEPADATADAALLAARLKDARTADSDSPLYQLLQDYPNVAHEKTDVFRERVEYSVSIKHRLEQARQLDKGAREAAIRAVEADLKPLEDAESGALVDLLLSYRAVKAWSDMVALVERMPAPLRESVLVQEQFGFALNRDGRSQDAERVLVELIARRGASSETYGILGRVYKDRWEEALRDQHTALASGLLRKAADAYRKGFETDWRDAYPGINAVTLMELMEPPDPRRLTLLPVVRYAVDRKIAAGRPDYWDYASQVELAVLALDEHAANEALGQALANIRESWEPETSARNLRLIRDARARRGQPVPWLTEIIGQLEQAAGG
jgi:MAP3K TRAFs-binding domain